MSTFFVMFSTDPDVDPRKCAVGLACAAQAVDDGHEVNVFFASHSVRLLHKEFIGNLDAAVGMPGGACQGLLDTLISGANISCSTGSQAVVGVTPENASEVLVDTNNLNWSGPPGVVALSAAADICLSF